MIDTDQSKNGFGFKCNQCHRLNLEDWIDLTSPSVFTVNRLLQPYVPGYDGHIKGAYSMHAHANITICVIIHAVLCVVTLNTIAIST